MPVNDVLNHSAAFYFGINGFMGGAEKWSINSAANVCAQFSLEEKRGVYVFPGKDPQHGVYERGTGRGQEDAGPVLHNKPKLWSL